MKFTKLELHELNQMIDKQEATIMMGYKHLIKDLIPEVHKDMITRINKSAVDNYDLLETIRAKINKEDIKQ